MSLLSIDNLNVQIDQTPILRAINLSVAPSEIVGVIGESGSGKSMLAYSILGLLPNGAEVQGQISVSGESLVGADERCYSALRGAKVGMVFQEPMSALNPLQTIGTQVSEMFRLHRKMRPAAARSAAREVLDRVGLMDIAEQRYPHELSGGQRQRVVIAIAVALRPKLLIADEPTTALDVLAQAQILSLLKEIAEDGTGLVLISHDLAVVAEMAHSVAIMQSGAIVEAGPTWPLLSNLKHSYSQSLFSASDHCPARKEQDTSKPLLSVSDLNCEYISPKKHIFERSRRFFAVRSVSFDISVGESVGLVGASGCGKSTLARTILGLSRQNSGVVRFFDAQQTPVEADTWQQVQAVFQDPYGSFNPRKRVRWLLAEPMTRYTASMSRQQRAQAISEALEQVGMMSTDADKYIHEFSGGQRQRLAIARALINRPRLVVLDEAVSALDVSIQAQILDLIAELGNRLGLSFLFISHDLSVVRRITDRVLVMHEGQIVEQGDSAAVFACPQHPYTQRLLNAAPNLSRALLQRQLQRK